MRQIELMKVLEAPVISEKSSLSAEKEKRVVFKVRKNSTKQQIKRAVEMLFEVEVDSVHVLNVKGKQKRFGRFIGARSDWKKAYIKLKPGFDIDFASA
ncbi:50S ribosomal protein L23 [Methyloparacoccus murrellii]